MTDVHIVLDDTAMVTAGRGRILVSRLIHRAHAEVGWYLYAPACALVEADHARAGTAEHLAALPGLIVLDLDLPAALAVAADPPDWSIPHISTRPSPPRERPDGAVIATTDPQRWQQRPVRLLDLT